MLLLRLAFSVLFWSTSPIEFVELLPAERETLKACTLFASVYPASHSQSAICKLPTGEVAEDGQDEHDEDALPPSNFPSAHKRHTLEPFDQVYLPGPHAIHGPMSAPAYPALQVQLLLPSPENVFAGQFEQFDSDATEYLPALHTRQEVAFRMPAYLPATQRLQKVADKILEALPFSHPVQNDDPFTLEYFPAPHDWHVSALLVFEKNPAAHFVQAVEPVSFENLPTSHDVQLGDPSTSEYFPAPHKEHELAPGGENVPARHRPHRGILAMCEKVPVLHMVHNAEPLASL